MEPDQDYDSTWGHGAVKWAGEVLDRVEGRHGPISLAGPGLPEPDAEKVRDATTLREVSAPTRGSGQVNCCGGHRDRCLFGDMHSWSTWFENGQLQRTHQTYRCHHCAGVCTGEEQDIVGEVWRTDLDGLYAVVAVQEDGIWCQRTRGGFADRYGDSFQVHPQHFIGWDVIGKQS